MVFGFDIYVISFEESISSSWTCSILYRRSETYQYPIASMYGIFTYIYHMPFMDGMGINIHDDNLLEVPVGQVQY